MKIKYSDGSIVYVDEHDFDSSDVEYNYENTTYKGSRVEYIMDDDYNEEDDY